MPAKAVPVSERERRFLTARDAWDLAMSGRFSSVGEVLAALAEDPSHVPLTGPHLLGKLDEVCRASANALGAVGAAPPIAGTEEGRIWAVLEAEQRCYWLRDDAGYRAVHLQEPHLHCLAWVQSGGMTVRHGWEEFARSWQGDLDKFPTPNVYLATHARFANRQLSVGGDMASASYDVIHDVGDLPELNTFGTTHCLRVLERRHERWLISSRCDLDDQFGQTTAPTWQVDATGRVIVANAAAQAFEADWISIRGGRLRLAGTENDARLKAAIRSAAEVTSGIYSHYRARSTVVEPDGGSPAQVLWVVNQGGKLRVSLTGGPTLRVRVETAATGFGLSPAQARLALALVDGTSLADAAQEEGISFATAKTQLQRMFDKVGVHSQSGLVSALIAAMERAPND